MNLHYRDGVNPVLPVINGDFDSQGFATAGQASHLALPELLREGGRAHR